METRVEVGWRSAFQFKSVSPKYSSFFAIAFYLSYNFICSNGGFHELAVCFLVTKCKTEHI